jgi:drug/metabolite transporter (DMT)-like permease
MSHLSEGGTAPFTADKPQGASLSVPSSTAGLLIVLTPLIAAVFATWLGSECPSWRRLVGLALGFLGLVAIYGFDLRRPTRWRCSPTQTRQSQSCLALWCLAKP